MRPTFYLRYGKGMFDRLCAAVGLLFLFPFFLILSLLVKLDSQGPVFFHHQRMGQYFKPFGLLKFRSMVQGASKIGPAITQGGDIRITTVGKYLRKYKLDELPQLLNVLLGDISLVGPRPEVEKYVYLYQDDYKKVLQVKPGITDYAAVEYSNEEEILAQYDDMEKAYIEEVLPVKIALYKKYLGNISFVEDVKILFSTFLKILGK